MEPDESTVTRRLQETLGQARPSASVEQRIVQGALARTRRRARYGPIWVPAVALGAAGVVAALWLGFREVPATRPHVSATSQPDWISPRAGKLYETASREARFAVGAHRVRLAPVGKALFVDVSIDSVDLVLRDGSVSCQVGSMDPGSTFRVRTRHLLAEVAGTRFEVHTQGSCSQVMVQEGSVHARGAGQTQDLGPGATQSFCEPPPRSEPSRREEELMQRALLLAGEQQDLARASQMFRRYLEEFDDGVFREEALFHLYLATQRLGQTADAEELAKQFLAQFPESDRARRLTTWLLERDQ